jgi:hypothetical protein
LISVRGVLSSPALSNFLARKARNPQPDRCRPYICTLYRTPKLLHALPDKDRKRRDSRQQLVHLHLWLALYPVASAPLSGAFYQRRISGATHRSPLDSELLPGLLKCALKCCVSTKLDDLRMHIGQDSHMSLCHVTSKCRRRTRDGHIPSPRRAVVSAK